MYINIGKEKMRNKKIKHFLNEVYSNRNVLGTFQYAQTTLVFVQANDWEHHDIRR